MVEKSGTHLFTRAGNDWSARFTPLCKAFSRLGVRDAVIDGEAVYASEDGTFSFHGLQTALSTGNLSHLRYYAFDLLHLNGVDLRARPLTERKSLLQHVIENAPDILQYSEHFAQPGDQILAHACRLALEGIVSKRADAPYCSGRSDAWLKSKCIKEQEFVIGGYTEQPKHPGMLGALLIGYYEKDVLRFAGKVGTGFSAAEGRAILQKLQACTVKTSAFEKLPTDARRSARFVEPKLVAHVKFGEWTADGKLRHPSFQGLRGDKPAREVVREKEKALTAIAITIVNPRKRPKANKAGDAAMVANVTITHPDRVLWPEAGITKLELAQYYAAIAPKLLAHAGNRPISLVRCPQGSRAQCFFQRHAGKGMSSHVRSVKVAGHGDGKPYIYVDDAEGLVSLVQMGTIELHAWNARVSNVKKPDRLIFDLDPAPDVKWQAVKHAARDVRENLKKLGLVSFLKTTGGKGVHIMVPFAPGPSWAEAKRFERAFSDIMAKADPDRFTINSRKDVRAGRIFIDYLRNDETASAVAAYSVRARPGAPVSLPIDWKALPRLKAGRIFSIKDALKRRKDPWASTAEAAQQTLPLK